MGLKIYLQTLGDRTIHSTAIRVALIVGTVIFCINHGSAFLHGAMTRTRWTSVVVTYFVPYCVNLHGQMASRMRQRAKVHLPSKP